MLGQRQTPTLFNAGVVTSPDLATWTKYAGNPVMLNSVPGTPVNVMGTWYTWAAQGPVRPIVGTRSYDPIEAIRYQSTNLLAWTSPTTSVHHSQLSEGVNNFVAPEGGFAPTAIVNINAKAYLYGISCPADGSFPQVFQVGLAIAAGSIGQIVTAGENGLQQTGTDSFQRADGSLGSNWVTPTGGTALQIASHLVEPSATSTVCQAVAVGTFPTNQYSEIQINTLTGAGSASVLYPLVRASTSALTDYEAEIGSPTGSVRPVGIYKRVAGSATALGLSQVDSGATDLFTLSVIDGSDGFPVLSLFQNGFLILQVQDQSATPLETGNPGMTAFSSIAITDAQMSAWFGGAANVIPAYPPNVGGGGCADFMLLGCGQG